MNLHEKDFRRQKEIIELLKCEFIRIINLQSLEGGFNEHS